MMNLSKTLYRYGRDPVSIALLVFHSYYQFNVLVSEG